MRGNAGKGSRLRKNAAWKEAHAMCRHLWHGGREKMLCRVLGITPIAMREATMRMILGAARAKLGHNQPQDDTATHTADAFVNVQ